MTLPTESPAAPERGEGKARGVGVKHEFGTFGGVFTPTILTILGVIMFMRANFVVSQAGIIQALAILALAKGITLFTTVSASAIATNMQVKGGGAYYLISRVLGPEFGGAIGIALFLAQAASVPFYILGFSEAVVQTFPQLHPHFLALTLSTAAALGVVTYIGAGWAIRAQYGIMAVLLASIVVFMGGALLRFSPATFIANLGSHYTAMDSRYPGGGSHHFWTIFAIYFPAVTGITAGINMSGDLKEPGRSIPAGTLAAVAVGFLVYLAQILVSGGAFSREALADRPYLILVDNALFGAGFMVAAGMFAATLSSALGSFMGAPRVLQAVSRDRILRSLQFFAKGSLHGDEPRRAIILTGLVTLGVLLWAGGDSGGGPLNVVAGVITMFFLYTYGMLNLAAFIETVGDNPSFRPRFRYFHWTTALLGAIGCIVAAFVIAPTQAVVAVVLLAALVWYIKRKELRSTFGDARRGFFYKAVRNSLIRLSQMPESPKNWRPTALVFADEPEFRESLASFGVWLEAGRGIVYLANILEGDFKRYGPRREAAAQQLTQFCRERGVYAFPIVVVAADRDEGIKSVLQSVSIGPLRPNLALFGWEGVLSQVQDYDEQFRVAQAMDMGLVIINSQPTLRRPRHRRIDVWWRGRKNGSLMLILAHLLTQNWEWAGAEIRLLRVIKDKAGHDSTRDALRQLISDARVDCREQVVVSDRPFAEMLHKESAQSDCVLLGFEIPEAADSVQWCSQYESLLEGLPTTLLICSAEGLEDVTA